VPKIAAKTAPKKAAPGKSATRTNATVPAITIAGAPRDMQSLRVRLQNVAPQAVAGTLRVQAPQGWTLERESQAFRLEAGASRIYRFAVAVSQRNAKASYPVTVTADVPRDRYRWKQNLVVATADNVKAGSSIEVDGDLKEWRDASWMQLEAKSVGGGAASTRRGARPLNARLAVRWDGRRVFFAARVQEPSLQPRRPEAASYPFWDDYDAIQIAFGLRDDAASKPARHSFRDTDYGFLLSPFDSDPDGVQGRLLRLWSPTAAFDPQRDTLRWGGAVPGARCAIRRDEANQITTYEASFPLSEMPTLRPARRAAQDIPVRFSWIVHSDEGRALEWSRATEVFPWWSNTGSFLPAQYVLRAAQTALGFTQNGAVAEGDAVPEPPPYRVRPPVVEPPPVEIPPFAVPPLAVPAPDSEAEPQLAPMPVRPSRVPPSRVRSTPVNSRPVRTRPRTPAVEPWQPSALPPAPVRSDPLPQLPPSPPE
jgi:hypothetical protein